LRRKPLLAKLGLFSLISKDLCLINTQRQEGKNIREETGMNWEAAKERKKARRKEGKKSFLGSTLCV
jgi:hypothetical protein